MTVKELREPLFDTYQVAAAAAPVPMPARIQFFAIGKSPTKGAQLTNMNDDGQLPAPERMSVYRAPRLAFIGMIAADVTAILQAYYARLVVNGATVFTAPLEYCGGGGGVSSDPQNGTPSLEAVIAWPEEYRIDIESGEKFTLELVTEGTPPTPTANNAATPGTGVFIRAMLDGVHTLPVG